MTSCLFHRLSKFIIIIITILYIDLKSSFLKLFSLYESAKQTRELLLGIAILSLTLGAKAAQCNYDSELGIYAPCTMHWENQGLRMGFTKTYNLDKE